MVDHGIHGSGIYPEVQTGPAEFAEIPQVIPPVGLRHDRHPVAVLLEPAGYDGSTERRMVHKGIAAENDDVDIIPSQGSDLLDRSRYHFRRFHLRIALRLTE